MSGPTWGMDVSGTLSNRDIEPPTMCRTCPMHVYMHADTHADTHTYTHAYTYAYAHVHATCLQLPPRTPGILQRHLADHLHFSF